MTPIPTEKSASVYAPTPESGKKEKHTLALLVDNEPGTLARIVGLFSGRGYNIDSLHVEETDREQHLSSMMIVCSSTQAVLEQIIAQLERLVPVREVRNITNENL